MSAAEEPTMQWFRIMRWGREKIKPVTVVKETKQQVVYVDDDWGKPKERRALKGGEFFPTWDEARAHLLANAERNVVSARVGLSRAQSEYGNIKGMKRPDAGRT